MLNLSQRLRQEADEVKKFAMEKISENDQLKEQLMAAEYQIVELKKQTSSQTDFKQLYEEQEHINVQLVADNEELQAMIQEYISAQQK